MFFKDPQQIVAEYKSRHSTVNCSQMEYETNGVSVHYDDGLMAQPAENRDSPSPDHLDYGKASSTTSAPTPPIVAHEPAIDGSDFFLGTKNSNGDISGIVQSSYNKSNGDGDQFSSNDSNNIEHGIDNEHDDFGPETDVDATDDAAISPISPSVSIHFESEWAVG